MGLFDFITNGGDNSGTSSGGEGGLLGSLMGLTPDQQQQYNSARLSSGLLGLGSGLIAGGAPSRLPNNLMTAFGTGIQGYQNSMKSLSDQTLAAAQTGAQVQDTAYKKLQGQSLLLDMDFARQEAAHAVNAFGGTSAAAPGTSGSTIPPPGTVPPPALGTPLAAVHDDLASIHLPVIRQFESNNNYNAGYTPPGQKTVVDVSGYPVDDTGFPMWPGNKGPAGNSTAAGAYQIVGSTWRPIARDLGITDFSPASQDRVAAELYARYGLAPWTPYNAKLRSAIAGLPASVFPAPSTSTAAAPGETPPLSAGNGPSTGPAQAPSSAGGNAPGGAAQIPPGLLSLIGAQPQSSPGIAALAGLLPSISDVGQQSDNRPPGSSLLSNGQSALPPGAKFNSQGTAYNPTPVASVPAGTPGAGPVITPAQAQQMNAGRPVGQGMPVMPSDYVFGPGRVAPPPGSMAAQGGSTAPQTVAQTPMAAQPGLMAAAARGGPAAPQVQPAQQQIPPAQPLPGLTPVPSPPGFTPQQVAEARLAVFFASLRGKTPDPTLAAIAGYAITAGLKRDEANATAQATHQFNPPSVRPGNTALGPDGKYYMAPQWMDGPPDAQGRPTKILIGNVPGQQAAAPGAAPQTPGTSPPQAPGAVPQAPGSPPQSSVPPGSPTQIVTGAPSKFNPYGFDFTPKIGEGPGQNQPMVVPPSTSHPAFSSVPPLSAQPPMTGSEVSLTKDQENWGGTAQKMADAQQGIQQSRQLLTTMADIFHRYQSGQFAEYSSELAAKVSALTGIPVSAISTNDPAQMQQLLKDNFATSLATMKATGLSRWTQMELKSTSANFANPDLQPAANFAIIAQDMGKINQAEAMSQDWAAAQKNGWKNINAFATSWYQDPTNSLQNFVDRAKVKMPTFAGMTNEDAKTMMPQTASGPNGKMIHQNGEWRPL